MKSGILFTSALALLGMSVGTTVYAAGNAQVGQAKAAAVCGACHGADGNSVASPEWPSLAGQHESYLIKQLKAFRSGQRTNMVMAAQAQSLSDQEIEDVAAYFSTQKAKGLEADKSKAALGAQIYRGGIASAQIPACLACHGPNGRGNPTANYPALRGQHASYVSLQLHAYQKHERKTDQNDMMQTVSGKLNDEQIAAVATYIQGLR